MLILIRKGTFKIDAGGLRQTKMLTHIRQGNDDRSQLEQIAMNL